MPSAKYKPEYSKRRKKGFTLVELAIVLVIVGLLIGGIVSAQSMIQSSRITSQASQIGQFDAGVANFKQKYNYLPGDAPAFGGDGNGRITGKDTGYPYRIVKFNCETGNFWNNLFPDDYVTTSCSAGTGANALFSGSSKNVVPAKMGGKNTFFIASAANQQGDDYDAIYNENYYIMVNNDYKASTTTGFFFPTANVAADKKPTKPLELKALDTKIDDGLATTGYVTSGWFIVGSSGTNSMPVNDDGSGAISCVTWSATAGAYIYDLSNSSYECTPFIRMGAQMGDPQ